MERRRMWLAILITSFLIFLIFYIVNTIKQSKYQKFIDGSVLNEIANNESKSIFNIKELNIKELKDRIILLNVYNIQDFSYIFSLNLANKIEQKYHNKVVVIDIIADNFNLEKNTIINYIIKNNIERPVINIENFDLGSDTRNYDKYFVLVDKNGMIKTIKNHPSKIKALAMYLPALYKAKTKK